jgi:hypothetical protein
MGQARDQAGNIWEVDEQGNAVRLISAASSPLNTVVAPNPVRAAKEAMERNRQQSSDSREAERLRIAQREEERKQREFDATHNPDGTPKPTADTRNNASGGAQVRQKALAQWSSAKQLDSTIAELEKLYQEGPGSTHGIGGAQDFLPTESNQRFNTAANAARGIVRNALGLTGGEANTATEAQMNLGAYIPQAGQYDQTITDSIERLKGLRDLARRQAIATLGGIPDANGRITPLADASAGKAQQRADNEVPDPTTGADTKPPPTTKADAPPPENADKFIATGNQRTTYDQRTSSQIDAMINAGASKGMIDAVLQKQKLPVVSANEWGAIQKWRAQNPGKKYFGANISHTDDLNIGQRLAGSAPAAGIAHAADAATAGTLGAITDPGALDAMEAMHPGPSLTGDIVGGVTGAAGAEAGLAARAPAALARYAPRIADALYGGLTGFNGAQEGEGATGAAIGAGAGIAGGVIGQRLLGGLGSAARGVQNANVGYLRGQGVPLTVGQAVGGSGRLGATIKNVEDALTSVPGVSSIVNARRMEGLGAFNQAAMRQAGAPAGIEVNTTGAQGMEQLRQGIGPAYDRALGGAQINTQDPNFLQELQQVVDAANAIPPVNGAREAAATALDSRLMGATDPDTGIISGRGFQEAYRGLGRTSRERANSDYGHEVGQVMRQGQNVLADALDAQNPGALDAFRSANAANRNANVIAQALDKAKNQGDELFTPAQVNTADAMSARRLEGPMASAAGDRPFFDLARAGQEILPSKLPDSGTATRGLVGASLIGGIGGAGVGSAFGDAGTGAQTGLGLTLLLAAGGSRPAQRAMVAALTRRPDAMRIIGNTIARNAGIGGWTGAGALTPLLVGN